jgi:hypothetical protein
MIKKYTAYITYLLKNTDNGNSDFIHCNYINKVGLDEIDIGKLIIYFNNPMGGFRFLNGPSLGLGYNANEIYLLIQIVENMLNDDLTYGVVEPLSDGWKILEITDQIDGQFNGVDIESSVFTFPLTIYDSLDSYSLTTHLLDINYPETGDNNNLSFGDEEFFFGNVETDVEATILTTNIPIYLPPNEFNSTTNKTWDGESEVFVSEVGIYDEDNNLVAIGKLNYPIRKAAGVSRTLLFGFDF